MKLLDILLVQDLAIVVLWISMERRDTMKKERTGMSKNGSVWAVCCRIAMLACCSVGVFHVLATGSSPARISLDLLERRVSPRKLRLGALAEVLNFNDGLSRTEEYRAFANDIVTNDWRSVLAGIGEIATNDVERLLIIGTGRTSDENLYIDYLDLLSTLKTNGVISARELEWFEASSQDDQMTCLARRHTEQKVRRLVEKLRIALPDAEAWNDILSGLAYTNLLENASDTVNEQ